MTVEILISKLPKAELHLHIEGTLTPSMMWNLAQKHNIELPYANVDAITQAYQFEDLQSFLDLYYQGMNVLQDEDDYYQLMKAYFEQCKAQNIVHAEIMFDPQGHTSRGIAYSTFMSGFQRARDEAKEMGISSYLILSFLRDLSEEDALKTLEEAKPYLSEITAIGLDSAEVGNPPEKFVRAFDQARKLGLKTVAHAGEEGPASYVWQAISLLKVNRIDHGVRASEDNKLMAYLRQTNTPLTVCPQSNLKLGVVNSIAEHNIIALLNEGLCVTVNSDDPSYFGGDLNDNFLALVEELDMNADQCIQLIKNSFVASFLPKQEKQKWLDSIAELSADSVAA